jgi:hypothetical protein
MTRLVLNDTHLGDRLIVNVCVQNRRVNRIHIRINWFQNDERAFVSLFKLRPKNEFLY